MTRLRFLNQHLKVIISKIKWGKVQKYKLWLKLLCVSNFNFTEIEPLELFLQINNKRIKWQLQLISFNYFWFCCVSFVEKVWKESKKYCWM